MKRFLLFFMLAIAVPLQAQAAARSPKTLTYKHTSGGSVTLLNGVALNATESSRTITLNTDGWSKLRVYLYYTYSAATDVRAVFSCSMDAGANFALLQTRAIASGVATLSDFVDVKSTGSANQLIMLEYDTRGCDKTKIVFSGTSAGAGDTVIVQATSIAGF